MVLKNFNQEVKVDFETEGDQVKEKCSIQREQVFKVITERVFQQLLHAKLRWIPLRLVNNTTQSAITCSKFTVETLGQGVKYIQS